MKKTYLTFALGAMLALAGCGTKHSDNNSDGSASQDTVETTIIQEGAPDGNSPVAIVDNHIIPVDDFGTIVDFYADWCPPCKKLKPIFEQFKAKYDGRLNFVSFNVDQYQNLASTYGITNIPTLVFISADGKELGRMVGLHSPEDIEAQMASYFPEEMK